VAACASRAEPPASTIQVLESVREKHKIPGIAVVVVKDGQICDRAAAGIRKSGESVLVTTNDLFHIGSCTKSMTATLAAVLIEEGKLRWDTTIASIFPELKGKIDKAYEQVTMEQLLTHRGGVPGEPPKLAWLRAWAQEDTPTRQRFEFIKAVMSKPPAAAPGEKWIYSNQGYAIAGAMLERIAGQSWESLMTNRLFRPLAMNSAGFGPPGAPGKIEQPWGHSRFLGMTTASQTDNPPAIGPAGIVHCSLDDLARYAVAHMEGERNGGLLKPETFRKLHTAPPGGDYAFGWGCVNNPSAGRVLTHAGSNTMFYLFMWLAPQKDMAVLVGMNIGGEGAEKGSIEVTRAMLKKWLAEETR